MPIVAQGADGTISLDVRNGTGDPADPDPGTLTLSVNDLYGDPQAGFPVSYPGDIIKDSVGNYHYIWTVPADQDMQSYRAVWDAILLGAPSEALESWEVVAPGTLTAGGLDFLLKPDDYDAIRGLLGVTTLDVEDTQIEYMAFGPQAELLVKRRVSNWQTQMTDQTNLFVLRLASVYQTACLMAESYVHGGTIGLVRPLSIGEGRDWAAAAKEFCSRAQYWIDIADTADDPDNSDAMYTIHPMRVGGPTTNRISRRRHHGWVAGTYGPYNNLLLDWAWWNYPTQRIPPG